MGVLRDSRSSLLAMLEAFLYDPLLSWTVSSRYRNALIQSSSASGSAQTQGSASREAVSQTIVATHRRAAPHAVPQSVAPVRSNGQGGDSDLFNRIDNSLIDAYLEGDSYMAKASGTGMTNRKALHVSSALEWP